jgi:hypothetical protein
MLHGLYPRTQRRGQHESPWSRLGRIVLLGLGLALFVRGFTARPAPERLWFTDDFESGKLDAWQFPYPQDWAIVETGGDHYLHMVKNREPGVPRRPLQFALLKGVKAGNFSFETRVRREGRSMIVVFDYVDTLHFYYAHLSGDRGTAQPVHNGVFIVNDSDRVRIAGTDAPPALPDHDWHLIRVERNATSGAIDVYSDVQGGPIFSVVDRTFACGQIGIGSFDETGDFDNVTLISDDEGCSSINPQPSAQAPARLGDLSTAERVIGGNPN